MIERISSRIYFLSLAIEYFGFCRLWSSTSGAFRGS
ncbi:unnamed protein product [Amoebophrya sp. A25]|nr:unnamed protein product [Amoebophrya sp. A25]|eukprot:GSA25T00007929001.1